MPEPVILYVCITCRAEGDASEPRAGARLLDALKKALAERGASHHRPHPEVPRSGLEGGLQPDTRSLEGSFEARLRLAPQNEVVESEERRTGLRIEPVECLSVCKRACTVAVASPGRWTYVYGDLDPAESAQTILDGIGLYAGTPDGIVPWRARPQAFKSGVVARIPPIAPRTPEAAE